MRKEVEKRILDAKNAATMSEMARAMEIIENEMKLGALNMEALDVRSIVDAALTIKRGQGYLEGLALASELLGEE